jgi:hypothetical protein
MSFATVTFVSDLENYDPTDISDGARFHVAGKTALNDGGEGVFYWDSDATDTANGGTIVATSESATGRFKRVLDAGPVNVKWFGATGNGSTDDTSAIQAAIDAVEASGRGVVYVPAGEYLISSALTITADGVKIQGDQSSFEPGAVGTTATVLLCSWGDIGDDDVITATGDNIEFCDISFIGDTLLSDGGYARSDGAAVAFTGDYVKFRRCCFNNQHNCAWMESGNYPIFEECNFRNFNAAAIRLNTYDGVTASTADRSAGTVSRCHFSTGGSVSNSCGVTSTGIGIHHRTGGNLKITGCGFINNDRDIYTEWALADQPSIQLLIQGNTFDSPRPANAVEVELDNTLGNAAGNDFFEVSITDNIFVTTADDTALKIGAGFRWGTIVGNVFNNLGSAIDIETGVYWTICGNTIVGAGTAIAIGSTQQQIFVVGNNLSGATTKITYTHGTTVYLNNNTGADDTKTSTVITDASSTQALQVKVTGDTNGRFYVRSDGVIAWGSGSAGTDTNLYRSSSGVVKTDGNLSAGAAISATTYLQTGVPTGGGTVKQWKLGEYSSGAPTPDGKVLVEINGVAYYLSAEAV